MFRTSKSAVVISSIYLAIGTGWVIGSSQYVQKSLTDTSQINLLYNQTLLRGFFILFSTVLLFALIRLYTRKLEKSLQQNLRLFEENPHPMWVFDQETLRFLAVNNAAMEKYGYSRDEFLEMTIKEIRPREEVERLVRKRKELRAGFQAAGIWRHCTKSGKLLDVEISSHFMEFDGRKAELILALDVTDRTRYENQIIELANTLEVKVNERTRDLHESLQEQAALTEELETYNEELMSTNDQLIAAQEVIQRQARELVLTSEHKLNLVLNNVTDFIWSARYSDHRFEVDMMSPAVKNIMGFTEEEYIENPLIWFDVVPDEDKHILLTFLSDVANAPYHELTHRILHRDSQQVRYVLSRVWVTPTQEIGSVQLNGIMSDITERKLQEEEKTRLMEQLVSHNHDLMQFSYIASHNLRGPVASILGIVQLARANKNPEELNLLVAHLHTSANRLDDVIKDLNKVLEIRDHQSLPKEWITLADILEDVRQNLGDSIATHNATLHCEISALPSLFTIKSYFHSIVYNLIANSLKYRSPDREPHIKISAEITKATASIRFTDNGLGIDMDKHGKKLFNLYQRFHNHVEGKGLGLYLVRTQTTALGGNITIASEPDVGTEFTIAFPMNTIRPTS